MRFIGVVDATPQSHHHMIAARRALGCAAMTEDF
jgi:hypothetical protein